MEETTQCPRCHCKESRVLETREPRIHGFYIKIRKRVCRHCGKIFMTKEVLTSLDSPPLSHKPNSLTSSERVKTHRDKKPTTPQPADELDIIPLSSPEKAEEKEEDQSNNNTNPFL